MSNSEKMASFLHCHVCAEGHGTHFDLRICAFALHGHGLSSHAKKRQVNSLCVGCWTPCGQNVMRHIPRVGWCVPTTTNILFHVLVCAQELIMAQMVRLACLQRAVACVVCAFSDLCLAQSVFPVCHRVQRSLWYGHTRSDCVSDVCTCILGQCDVIACLICPRVTLADVYSMCGGGIC